MRPHRWQPTRLHRPCDSPGKNTGVACHFLLQCMDILVYPNKESSYSGVFISVGWLGQRAHVFYLSSYCQLVLWETPWAFSVRHGKVNRRPLSVPWAECITHTLASAQPRRQQEPGRETGRRGPCWAHPGPLPVVAVDQVENHHVCGVDELALRGPEGPIWRTLGWRPVAHAVEETAVSYLTALWT